MSLENTDVEQPVAGVEAPPAVIAEAPSPEGQSPAPAGANLPGWVQPRIGMLTREKHEEKQARLAAEARAAAAEAALAEFTKTEAGAAGQRPVSGVTPRTLTLEEAEAYAEQKAQNLRFQQQTQEIYSKGKELYKDDFDKDLQGLANVGFGNNPQSKSLVEAAIATGAAPEVLAVLAKDLNSAGRILQLPPVQMAVELAGMVRKGKNGAAPRISSAPEPAPSRVSGSGAGVAPSLYDTEKLSVEEWIEQRNKTARKKRR